MPDTRTHEPAVLPDPHAKVITPPGPEAQWLVLEYLAADNDLEGELLADLAEMERVGSTPGVVEILAQVDRSPGNDASKGNWHGSRRYYVTRGTDPRKISSRVLADLGPTNTGDPGVLESYIRFGALRYPARATALVLLNHGSGFYVPPDMQAHARAAHEASTPRARRRRRPPIFHTTRERLRETAPADRGIAYDDGASDCLDNQELKRVLATAHRALGRKVDLVGMDACLMTMIEVAYQLRDHAQVLVGSEDVEPGPGWPHAAILADLTKHPAMTGAELGAAVVQRYVESYRHGGEDATQSAINLGRLDDLVEAVDVLARRLLAGLKSAAVIASLLAARRKTLQFFEGLYVDLYHLAANLATTAGNSLIADACRDVQRIIDGDEVRSPIIAQAHAGAPMAPARGLSIYFPLFLDRSAFYRELDFARATRWADLLDAYLGTGRRGDAR
ncbi:MAG: clostripain-related cysteine peptidase [Candidatus Rokubacteria bacterium]|nr:clostripain-related cysteine peptidase [Candidatus Rokubacteria bacterium]